MIEEFFTLMYSAAKTLNAFFSKCCFQSRWWKFFFETAEPIGLKFSHDILKYIFQVMIEGIQFLTMILIFQPTLNCRFSHKKWIFLFGTPPFSQKSKFLLVLRSLLALIYSNNNVFWLILIEPQKIIVQSILPRLF